MKLLNKLTLFITVSKLALVILFVLTLPYLTSNIARNYTDYNLRLQKNKVLEIVAEKGVDSYLQGEESYGSYTMLREEYISLEPVDASLVSDTIYTAERIIEQDTLSYRVLSYSLKASDNVYLLEIGKAVTTIEQYNRPLQRIATVVLLGLIIITVILDLIYTRYLLHPLGWIIRTRLRNRRFPFNEELIPIQTSTTDFRYLDNSLMDLMDQIHIAFEKEREFTANASHELMTPIGILQNKIENLMDEPFVPEPVQERLLGMQRTLNRLKRIVHSLLLISRIDNDQFSKTETISVKLLVEEVIEEIGHRLNERDISLTSRIDEAVMLKEVNHDLIFQMMYNLINNAIKYNQIKGSITIQDEHLENGYILQIMDTGVGIPAEDLPAIFNRFKKSRRGPEMEGGYGLGLSIVKSIADYHNIGISVESEEGAGTSFTLSFPSGILR